MIARLIELYRWIFHRLPMLFTIPMVILLVLFFLLVFPWLAYQVVPELTGLTSEQRLSGFRISWLIGRPLLSSIITTMFAIGGMLICYLLAVFFYSRARRPVRAAVSYQPQLSSGIAPDPIRFEELRKHNIGIILAGGGAKGAYQAGALQAIHEFLEHNDALGSVRMIAGTSIGSWNSLFWLADLIKKPRGFNSFLQDWWENVAIAPLIMPDFYIPFMKNSFLSTTPWQEQFDAIFKKNDEIRKQLECLLSASNGAIHFYLTRSNVARAELEFTTNRQNLDHAKPNLPGERPRPAVNPGSYKVAKSVEDIKEAVFSSMDLPPLFPYFSIKDSYFEDGGVVDNLPLRFATELEKCELIFVLPLNATFEKEVNTTSILRRLLRVMDVRQGVLEKNSFKQAYLYNELAELRHKLESREQELRDLAQKAPKDSDVARMLSEIVKHLPPLSTIGASAENQRIEPGMQARIRTHESVNIFAICPNPQLKVNTAEFWKTKEAGAAFRIMYEATGIALNKYFSDPPARTGMFRVTPAGKPEFFVDF